MNKRLFVVKRKKSNEYYRTDGEAYALYTTDINMAMTFKSFRMARVFASSEDEVIQVKIVRIQKVSK